MTAAKSTPMVVSYRLPITIARFVGTRTTVIDELGDQPERPTVVSSILVEVRADPRIDLTLKIPTDTQSKLRVNLGFLDDGRLVSTESAWEASGASRLKAYASLASFGLAAGAAIGGPVGAAAGFVIGGAVAAFAVESNETVADRSAGQDELAHVLTGQEELSTGELLAQKGGPQVLRHIDVDQLSPQELGVHQRYVKERGNEAHLLLGFRRAEVRQLQRLSELANAASDHPVMLAKNLGAIDQALLTSRRVAQRSEDLYAAWRQSHITERVESLSAELFVDEIPTTQQLEIELTLASAKRQSAWWKVAREHRVMVTCDRQLPDEAGTPSPAAVSSAASGEPGPAQLSFRRPVPAKLTKWQIEKDSSGRDRARATAHEWVLVTHPDHGGIITVPALLKDDASINVSFSPIGAITAIGSEITGHLASRASTIAELPATITAATAAGTSIGNLVSPASVLAARVTELENRKKLGLVSAQPDPNENLKAQLTEAELLARLEIARQTVTDPASAGFVVRIEHEGD